MSAGVAAARVAVLAWVALAGCGPQERAIESDPGAPAAAEGPSAPAAPPSSADGSEDDEAGRLAWSNTLVGPSHEQRAAATKGQYIVVLKEGVGAQGIVEPAQADSESAALATKVGGRVRRTFQHAIKGFSAELSVEGAQALAADPRVALVQENHVYRVFGSQTFPSWGLDRADQRPLPLSNTFGFPSWGTGVHVYVIDTGIRATHADFEGRASLDFSSIDDGRGANDCDGHGTHVAGTVGGRTYGIAKGARLHAVRVLDCDGYGTTESVVAGIDWVTANRIKPAVANMSLGGPPDGVLDAAVKRSIAAGVTYVVAAGNEHRSACLHSPARVPAALTVGYTQRADARGYWSNFGPCVDLFAPGEDIVSSWNTSNTARQTLTGTSMAAPHVSGVAALYLEQNPSATPAAVATAILAATTPNVVTDAEEGSPNRLLYSGFIPALPVGLDTTPPAASIVNPGMNATVSGKVLLRAATLDDTTIARVDFFVNGVSAGSDVTAPFQVNWDASAVEGLRTITATAFDSAGNMTTTAPLSVRVYRQAPYDSALLVPACRFSAASCSTGTLVTGRGKSEQRPELNQPNTLKNSSCSEWRPFSEYVSTHSIDKVSVRTVDGGPLKAGKSVEIEVRMTTFDGQWWDDDIDVFHSPSATAPVWTLVSTFKAPKYGANVFKLPFVLPAGGLQAFRAQARQVVQLSPCTSGTYDERDDLAFTVQP